VADLSITAGGVHIVGATTVTERALAGEAVSQGDAVYKGDDGQWYVADCTDAGKHAAVGIALTAGGAGDRVVVVTSGLMDLGATLTVGTVYVLSAAGNIAPAADLASSDYVTVLGVAVAADQFDVSIHASGAQVA